MVHIKRSANSMMKVKILCDDYLGKCEPTWSSTLRLWPQGRTFFVQFPIAFSIRKTCLLIIFPFVSNWHWSSHVNVVLWWGKRWLRWNSGPFSSTHLDLSSGRSAGELGGKDAQDNLFDFWENQKNPGSFFDHFISRYFQYLPFLKFLF